MATQLSSPAFTPFGSNIKDNGDSITSNISRKNLRAMYSPSSVKNELNETQLTATSPVLAAALEDVLRLSQEVFELRNARASLRQMRTPSRSRSEVLQARDVNRKECSSSDVSSAESPLEAVLALASPSPIIRPVADDTNKDQWTEIDLGDSSQTAVWVRTDSITFV